MNILVNIVERQHSIIDEIYTAHNQTSGNHTLLRLSVTDDGYGIAPVTIITTTPLCSVKLSYGMFRSFVPT